jgi:hypothetical protein
MKKENLKPVFPKVLYLITFFMLYAVIVFTPAIITGPAHITNNLIFKEETIEGTLLALLFLLSILILNLYKQEVFKHKKLVEKTKKDKMVVTGRLLESDQYIGMLNVQISEIKSIFNSISKYPETKAELKETYRYFGKRILGIVNSNWVLIRIINSNSQRTITEHFEIRLGITASYPRVSNKMIIEELSMPEYTSVISNPENLNILVFCIMPNCEISNDQRIFIQAIINEIIKLFMILKSSYYKNDIMIFEEDKPYKY